MLTVAIVSDQPISRAGLEKLASDDGGLRVAATVANVDELLAGGQTFDAVVLELPSGGTDNIARAATVGRPLVSAAWHRSPSLLAAVRAGARGCFSSLSEQRDVREAVRVIIRGGFYICPRLVDQFQGELARGGARSRTAWRPGRSRRCGSSPPASRTRRSRPAWASRRRRSIRTRSGSARN